MNRRDSTSSTDSWSIVHNRSAKEDDILMVDNDTADDASDILDSDIEIAEEAYNSYDDSDLELASERSDDEETTDSDSEMERDEEQQSDIGADEAEVDVHEEAENEENKDDSDSEQSADEQEHDGEEHSESESDEEIEANEEEPTPTKWCNIQDSEALEEEGKYYANPEKVKEKLGEFDCSPFDDWCLFVSRNKRVLATVILQISLVVALSAAVPLGMKLFADWMDEQIRSNCEPVKVTELSGLQSRWQSSIFIQDHRKRNALLPTFNASVLDEMRNLRKTRQALRIQPHRARLAPSKQISFALDMSMEVKPTTCLRTVHPTKALTVAPTVVFALRPVLSNDTVPEPCGIRTKRRPTPIPCKADVVGDSHFRAASRRQNYKKNKHARHACPRHLAPTAKPLAAPPPSQPTLKPRTRHTSPLPPPSNIRHSPAKWHAAKKSSSLTVLPKETSLRIIPTTTQRAFITGKSWQSARRHRQARNSSIPSRIVSPIWPMDVFPGMSLFSRKTVKTSVEKPRIQKIDYFYCSTNRSVPLYCPVRSTVKLPKAVRAKKIAPTPKRIILNHRKSNNVCVAPPVIKPARKQLPMVPPRKLIKLQKKQQKSPKVWNISKKSQTCAQLPLKESGLVKYQKEVKKVAKALSRMDKKKNDIRVLLHNYQHSAECRNVIQKVMKIQKKMKKTSEVTKKTKSSKMTKNT